METSAATAFNATATQKVAYDTVIGQRVKAIVMAEYSLEDFQALKRDVLKAALKVPIGLANSKSGCAYLILILNDLQKFTNDNTLAQAEIDNPGSETKLGGNDSHATIYRKISEKALKLTKNHTQEDTKSRLRDLIVAHVLAATILELKDHQFGHERVSPKEMLDHLEKGVEPTSILSLNDLMDMREAQMDFNDEGGLTKLFKNVNDII